MRLGKKLAMSVLRRLSPRSIRWLLVAVLAPLGVLLVMQYRFLRRIEASTIAAHRENLKGILETTAADVEGYYREKSTVALDVCPTETDPIDVTTLAHRFRKMRIDGARGYFVRVFGHDGTTEEYDFDAWGNEKESLDPGTDKAIRMAVAPWRVVANEREPIRNPGLVVDEHDPSHRMIIRPVSDLHWRIRGVVGIVIDDKLAKRDLIGPLICKNIDNCSGEMRKSDVKVVVAAIPKDDGTDGGGKTGGGSSPGGGTKRLDTLHQNFGFIFTNLRLDGSFKGVKPEEIAASNFRINMIWTLAVALLLVGSLWMMLRAMLREMKLSQMKSDFVSNVSHELRTPLSSIRVFGEYMGLGRVDRPDKVREYGRYIETESRRLTQLINNILDFSKIESSEKDYRFERADLGEIVAEVVEAFRVPLEKRDVRVDLELPDEGLDGVVVDRDAFVQALVNLLDNAVKYTPARPAVVEVVGRRRDDGVAISVRDHGVGIADDEKEKIFEKFYRVSTGLVHDVKGSGLGLAIVDHIVRAHGGRVEIASGHGRGSTFTIVLPAPGASDEPADEPGLVGGELGEPV